MLANNNMLFKNFISSTLAGILIGLGVIVNMSVDNPIIGAALFSTGLCSIVTFKLNLYTGKIGYINKGNTYKLLITLLGNMFGVMMTVFCLLHTNDELINIATKIASEKFNTNFLELFFNSIPCGILMFLAVEGYKRTANILYVMMCVMVFILSGYEHCIVYYFYMLTTLSWRIVGMFFVCVLGNSLGAIFARLVLGTTRRLKQ